MFDTLDALIATAAVVLGLSLVVQAIQQIIKQAADLKSSYMRDELFALFNTEAKTVKQVAGQLPAVVSFAAAGKDHIKKLIDELEKKLKGIGYNDIELLEHIDAAKLKEIIKSLPLKEILPPKVEKNFNKIVEEIESEIDRWFDLSKKAFQEHYQRRMKVWAFAISAAVVMGMNVNLVDTYTLFTTNKPVRDAAVAMGERLTSISSDSLSKLISTDTSKVKTDSLRIADMRTKTDAIEKIIQDKSFNLFGWQGAAVQRIRARSMLENIVVIPLGWLGMALLVSLGAPFWYDVLKTMMGIKDTLKKYNGFMKSSDK